MTASDRTKRSFFVTGLTLLMVLGTLGGLFTMDLPVAQGLPPTSPGDWIVDSTEVYDGGVWPGGVIAIDGNLTIEDGGNLTLQNGLVLQLNCTYGLEFHIEVQKGGILRLHSGSTVTVRDSNFNLAFFVREGATLEVTGNSIIEEVGLQNAAIEASGVYISTDKAKFDGAEIRNTASGIVIDNVSPTIKNSDIHDNSVSGMLIRGKGAGPRIEGNDIYNHFNPFGWVAGVFVIEDARPTFVQNTIHDNQVGIMAHHSTIIVDDNDIYDNNYNGNGLGIFGVNEANVTVTNSTFDGNTAGVGLSNSAKGTISHNEFMNHPNNGAGVSIGDMSKPTISNNTFHHNELGIYVGTLSKPEIAYNTMEDNQWGIITDHDLSYIHHNTIQGVDVAVNTNTGISASRYSEAKITDNTITNIEGGTGIRVDNYSNNLVKDNTITDCNANGIEIDDFATSKVIDNDITGSRGGIRIGQYAEPLIKGGVVEATEWDGINVDGGARPIIDGVDIDNSGTASSNVAALRSWYSDPVVTNSTIIGKDIDVIVGTESKVTLLNVDFDPDLVEFQYMIPGPGDRKSYLRVGWFLDVHVEWQNNAPVENATVEVVTDGYEMVHQVQTGADGNITTIPVIEYDRAHYDIWTNYTDHTVNASKNGVQTSSIVTMDRNRVITVQLDDTDDPFIDIISPLDGDAIAMNIFKMNGTSTDPQSGVEEVSVSTDGGTDWEVAITEDGWANWEIELNLTDGDYDIIARSMNLGGRLNETTISVIVDTVIDINVTHPVDGHLTNVANLTVNGTAEDGLKLKVNGKNVTIVNDTFTTNILLVEGDNTLTFNATDIAGNNLVFDRTVTLDSIAPVIDLTSPGPALHQYSTSANVTFEGMLSEVATVKVNGVDAKVDVANMTFVHGLTNLTDGDKAITIIATDAAGNEGTIDLVVTVDTVIPTLDVKSPVDGTITNVNVTLLNGTSDADLLTINGLNETIVNGTFTRNITLEEGANTFEFVATDLAGNKATLTIKVVLDTEDPYLMVLFPVDGLVTTESPVEVRGVTEPGANITVNGLELAVDEFGRFDGTVPVTEATTEMTIVATDQAGNEATEVRAIIYDGTMPSITFSGPKNGSIVVGKYVHVKGIVSEPDAIVTVNGKQVEVGTEGNFTYKVELFEGKNTIVIRAVDKGGNVYEDRIVVTRERTADLTWASIGLMFTFLGVFFGLVGGYAWGKFVATRERPRRRPLGTLEDQAKAVKGREPPQKRPPTEPVVDEGVEENTDHQEVKAEPRPEPRPAPKKEEPKPELKPAPKKEEPKPEPKPEPKKEEPKPEPKPEPKKEPPAGPPPKKEEPKPEPKKEEPKPAPKKEGEKVDDDLKDILSRLNI